MCTIPVTNSSTTGVRGRRPAYNRRPLWRWNWGLIIPNRTFCSRNLAVPVFHRETSSSVMKFVGLGPPSGPEFPACTVENARRTWITLSGHCVTRAKNYVIREQANNFVQRKKPARFFAQQKRACNLLRFSRCDNKCTLSMRKIIIIFGHLEGDFWLRPELGTTLEFPPTFSTRVFRDYFKGLQRHDSQEV